MRRAGNGEEKLQCIQKRKVGVNSADYFFSFLGKLPLICSYHDEDYIYIHNIKMDVLAPYLPSKVNKCVFKVQYSCCAWGIFHLTGIRIYCIPFPKFNS